MLNVIRSKIFRALKEPRLILWALRHLPLYYLRQARLALNYFLAGTPRAYRNIPPVWAIHPGLESYATHPPVHYTLYSLADICHFFNIVPDWNTKPFVVEFEHVLALGGNIRDWQHGLRRLKYIENLLANELCRVALAMSKGLMEHSKRYISDTVLHEKFDYLYPCYPTQKPRVMELSGPFTILTIASRFYDKGVPVALKAFERLRNHYGNQVQMMLVCHCLPEGYPLPDGVSVYPVPVLSRALKAKLYSNSHVLFLPVLFETFGCFPEAYAYGTPVVTTKIHHGDEAVREGVTGFLVEPPFFAYSDYYGIRWKTFEEFSEECKRAFDNGLLDNLIDQCVKCLDSMIVGNVDLRKMSAAAQVFHHEVFSVEVRNRKLRQIYRRAAGL